MAKIYAPNESYHGISATVVFKDGAGETSDLNLLEWFKRKGYRVEDEEYIVDSPVEEEYEDKSTEEELYIEPEPVSLKDMNMDQLKAYADEHGIDIGNSTSVRGILKKIRDAEK